MSNAIANISGALGYDAVETILASGGSLASAFAFAAQSLASAPVGDETLPESCRTVPVLAAVSACDRPTGF